LSFLMAIPRRPGQRAPRDRTWQRAQSTQAASSTRAGRTPGPRPRLRGPLVLIFFVLGVLLSIAAASAMPIRQEKFHQQLASPQGGKHSRSEKSCLPGFHMEEASGDCVPCTDKVDYTNYSNTLSSCLLCKTCKSGEEEKSPCTSTKDTECQCKPGTFRREDAPEFCYKCRTRCPDGMVVATPCSPFSDLTCVDRKSDTSQLVIILVAVIIAGCFLLVIMYLFRRFCIQGFSRFGMAPSLSPGPGLLVQCLSPQPTPCPWHCPWGGRCCNRALPTAQADASSLLGRGVDPKCMDKVLFWRSHPLRGSGALDNAHNNMLINRDSLIELVPEQEAEEQVKPTDATAQSQGEAKRLLVSVVPWPFCLPRTAVETGKGRCWSGLLSHGEVVMEGDHGHGGEGSPPPAMVDWQLLCYLSSVLVSRTARVVPPMIVQ
ncbi:hypothetical protein DBR06_SOUSAS4410045, partial [Sousa chinensis]